MDTSAKTEYKEMLFYECRLLMLENLVKEYRDNVKALKVCLKLIKIEYAKVLKSKTPTCISDFHTIQLRYPDLIENTKQLIHASKIDSVNKATDGLNNLIEKTEKDIDRLNELLNPAGDIQHKITSAFSNAAQFLSGKLGAGAQKLGEVVSNTVNSKVDDIKKVIAGDENSK